jgi:hypothetical protein
MEWLKETDRFGRSTRVAPVPGVHVGLVDGGVFRPAGAIGCRRSREFCLQANQSLCSGVVQVLIVRYLGVPGNRSRNPQTFTDVREVSAPAPTG